MASAMGVAKMGAIGLAAATGVAALKAVGMYNSYATEMLKIRTEGGATGKEFQSMSKQVNALAKSGQSMGQGPTQLAQGLYHLESMGLRGRKALQALKLASEEAAISGSRLEDTTTAVGGALFVNAKGTGSLSHMMGTLNAIAGAGNMRFQQLNEAMGTGLLSSAKVAGLSLQEVGAALAVLTDSGQHPSSAAATMATALHFLYSPTSKAQAALASIGIKQGQLANDLRKPQGLLAAFKDLRSHLAGLGKNQQADVLNAILPGGRGRVLLSLFQMQNRLGPKYNQIQATSGGFLQHVAEQAKNPSTQNATKLSQFQGDMVDLGRSLAPVVNWLRKAALAAGGWLAEALSKLVPIVGYAAKSVGVFAKGAAVWLANAFNNVKTAISAVVVGPMAAVEHWLHGAGKWIANFYNTGVRLFIKGFQEMLAPITAVSNALGVVGNAISSISPVTGGVTGTGTASQAQQFQNVVRGVTGTTPKVGKGHIKGTAGPKAGRIHAGANAIIVHHGDIVVHVAGKEFARINRREIHKAMMAGA